MRLNIGCGEKLLEDFTNIDKFPISDACMQGDLEQGINLEDACADEIILHNVIEHVDSIVNAMREIRRLLKQGGLVHISTPHCTSHSSWRDPTHQWHLSYFSFDMFCKTRNAHYLGGKMFEISKKKLPFGGGISLIGRVIFSVSPEFYEKKFCFWFPASTLYVCLKAV